MADTPTSARRPRRKWLVVLGGVLLLLIVVIALLPTLISWGLANGVIRSAINDSINGTATFDRVKAGWFGDQFIDNLRIVDAQGKEAANLDIAVHAGLFQIITKQPGPIEVTLSGTIAGEVREDNSISFQDLLKKPSGPQQPQPSPGPGKPFRISDIPPTTVNIAGLTVDLKILKTNQRLVLDNLTGKFAYVDPTQPITIDLQGKTLADGTPGSLDVHGQAADLFAPDGTLTLKGANVKLDAQVQSIPLPFQVPGVNAPVQVKTVTVSLVSDDLTGRIVASLNANAQIEGQPETTVEAQAALANVLNANGELALQGGSANITAIAQNLPIPAADLRGMVHQFKATIASSDLTKTTVIAIDSNAQIEDQAPSTLTASLSVDELFTPKGDVQVAIEKVTGTLQGSTLPTSILQPAVDRAGLPVVLSRDVGPVLDVNASFSAGATREVTLNALAALLTVEAKGTVDPQRRSLVGNHLLIDAKAINPELVKALANLTIDRATAARIQLTSFTVPPMDPATGSYRLQDFAATGTMNLAGPVAVTLPEKPATLEVQGVATQFNSPRLGESVAAQGTAMVNGGHIEFDERITKLFDAQGKLDLANAMPVGTLAVRDLPADTIKQFAPNRDALIDDVIGRSLSATLTTSASDSNLAASVQASGQNAQATLSAIREPDAINVLGGRLTLNMTPNLVAHLQQGAAKPIVLESAAAGAIDIQQFRMPATGPLQYALPKEPVHASLEVLSMTVNNVPGFVEPLNLSNVLANITTTLGSTPPRYEIDGDLTLNRPRAGQGVANIRHRSYLALGEQLTITSDMGFSELSVAHLEQMIGRQPGEISKWTGDRGNLAASLKGGGGSYQVHAHPLLPNVEAELDVMADPQFITVKGHTSKLILTRNALEQQMNPPPSGDAAAADRTRVLSDLAVEANLREIRIPRAMLADQSFDPKAVLVDVGITGGPLHMMSAGETEITLSNLVTSLTCADLNDGVQFTLRGKADAKLPPIEAAPGTPAARAAATQPARTISEPKPGVLDVSGKLVDLMGQDSKLSLATMKVQLDANVKQVPTAVADAAAKMEGLLVAAVGPLMDATIKANRFSPNTGRMDARIDATNGWLEATVAGRERSLNINKTNPLRAELALSPPLRDRVLYKIHPIFSDIRTTEQPLRVHVPWLQAPLDANGRFDISQLGANIEITLGKVEIDSGSTTLFLLKIFGQDQRKQTISGEIEPIIAKIRKGIVTYDRFAVHIDKYTLVYSGQIDLVHRTVNLRTEVPLRALGQSIQELEGFADQIVVPLVTRGKFGELKTSIDPDFDIGKAALDAGFKGGLEQLLKDKGGIGGLLDKLNDK